MRSIGNIIFVTVVLIVGYHFALSKLAGTQFKIFNYNVTITKCGPVINDRVDNIEHKVDELRKRQ